MKEIDARGYACPMPVIMVQKEVKVSAPTELKVLVDNVCAVENVTRFGRSQGYRVEHRAIEDDFEVTLSK